MKLQGKKIKILFIIIFLLIIFIAIYILPIINKDKNDSKKVIKETKVNNIKPEIKLIGAEELTIVINSEYFEKGATAFDDIDGDITSKIKIRGKVDTSKTGKYKIIYSVNDSSGNKNSVKRIINVIDVNEKDIDGISVLMYHYFYDDTKGESGKDSNYLAKSKFEEQLIYLKENNYYFPTMNEINMYLDGKIDLPEKSVVITMDDGHESNYSIAYPLALEYKIPMTMFVVTSWTDVSASLQKQMIDSGYISMQSHSHDMHKSGCSKMGHGGLMLCIEYEKGLEDLIKSKQLIGNADSFAYPCGDYNDHTIKMLKEAGYNLAFTTNYGKVKRGDNKLELSRVRINAGITLEQFKNSL